MSQVCAGRGDARRLGVLAVVAVLAALALHVGGARADGPGVGSPWVAGVGDSYISGEAATAPRRRRSTWAAASTARTSRAGGPRPPRATGRTPGLDFYVNGTKQGQALALQAFAASHNVKMIALSIGGNNFNFASIVQGCFQDWLLSPSWWKDSCNDDSSLKANFTAANVAAQTAAIKGAILNIRQAMANAGYADASYTILVQDYESPLPRGPGFRYGESGYTRQSTGGCGFWNNDANWANDSALPTINGAVRNAAAQTRTGQHQGPRAAVGLQRPPAVRAHGRSAGGEGPDLLDAGRRGRQARVDQPDPHGLDGLRALPGPGVAAPQLLGPTRPAQLRAPGLHRRPVRRAHPGRKHPGFRVIGAWPRGMRHNPDRETQRFLEGPSSKGQGKAGVP